MVAVTTEVIGTAGIDIDVEDTHGWKYVSGPEGVRSDLAVRNGSQFNGRGILNRLRTERTPR
ncbi:MAG: hypothetical protein SynsKO_34260 [Synoicihabitans sp.]